MDLMRAYLTAGCFAVCSLVKLEAMAWRAETLDATQRRSFGRASMTCDKMFRR